jgi:hypothetical protein
MVYIPRKYTYSTTSPKGTVRDYYISEKVPISPDLISKEEAKAIKQIAYRTRWMDPHTHNFVKTVPGGVAIIDTEARFYHDDMEKDKLKKEINNQMLFDPEPYNAEAINYLKTKRTKYNIFGKYPYQWWRSILPSKRDFYSQMGL